MHALCAISPILSYCNITLVIMPGAYNGQAHSLVSLATKLNFCGTGILFYIIHYDT